MHKHKGNEWVRASVNQTITKAVTPVAGLGTRMLPATKAIPKEMLSVVRILSKG